MINNFFDKIKGRIPFGLILVLPVVVLVGLLAGYPVFRTFYLSFSKLEFPSFNTRFVGFYQYVRFFEDPIFWLMLRNSFIWVVGCVVLQFLLALSAALLLSQTFKGRTVCRLIILLPWVVAGVVSASVWKWMYHSDFGFINWLPCLVGFDKWNVLWLGSKKTALAAIILANSWRMYPFPALMLLAGLEVIPKKSYDAAKVDGANWWQVFVFITIPYLKPLIAVILVLLTIWALNAFIYIFVMTFGGPANRTQIFPIYIYQTAFKDLQFGYASAIAVVLFVVVFGSTIFYLYLLRRGR